MRPSTDKIGARPDQAGETARTTATSGEPPRIWVLMGARTGDNVQARQLAEALGWPYREIPLAHNPWHHVPKGLQGASPRSLRSGGEHLRPPWPDVVIGTGQRSVPVARWIKRQANGSPRLVQIGRPRAPLAWFDLVITTPQYGLPQAPNVLHNLLPLNGVTTQALAAAAAEWQPRLAHLPRPRIGCILGGPSSSHRLDTATARRIAATADALAARAGGSVLMTTGPRTPANAAAAAEQALSVPANVYRWDRDRSQPNPFTAYLALADRFVVSGDSVSALSDTCATGKPVHVVPLPMRLGARVLAGAAALARPALPALTRRGIVTPPREIAAVHRALVAGGLASWTSDGQLLVEQPPARELDALIRSVAAVRRMLGVAPAVPPSLAYAGAESASAPRA
ncbi:hypothetical protein SAMN05216241_101517 [Limimonas halophila]|uniref:Fission protein ELM1 n=1 Tax=Limimonas halophila TaxID=1082479 RepID=A0A1G7M9M3_9PROT|nr:ELM1/GtrOC1 family putative glycosyltransferase [Limimonas halophila]SDF57929.1 hypothetical protein SAMN05216241_101517 [Limimonas halophila]